VTGIVRGSGRVVGRPIPAIVQWLRCRQVDSTLQFERWAAVYDSDDQAAAAYARALWRIAREMTTNTLKRVSGDRGNGKLEERRSHAGPDAYQKASRGELTLVADALVLTPE